MKKIFLVFTLSSIITLLIISCVDQPPAPVSGYRLAKNESINEMQSNAIRTIMSYNSKSNAFEGTLKNVTTKIIIKARIEVHLSNGTELGPTTPTDLDPAQIINVSLSAVGENFTRWTPLAEHGIPGTGS